MAFAQYRNGIGTPTHQRMLGWSGLRRAKEYGENHIPGLASRFLPIGFHTLQAVSCSDRRTSHLTNRSCRLTNHLPSSIDRTHSRADRFPVHALRLETASPRVLDRLLRLGTARCRPSATNIRLLRPSSSAPRTRLGVPTLGSLRRAHQLIGTHQSAREG